MSEHQAADLAVRKIRNKAERRSLPLVLLSEATIPKAPRRSLPSDENASRASQTTAGTRCKSFNLRKNIGSTRHTSHCDDREKIADSPLKDKHFRSQSGQLSLTVASTKSSENLVHVRRGSAHVESVPWKIPVAPNSRPSLTLRTASATNIIKQPQFDGTTDEKEELCPSIASYKAPSPLSSDFDRESQNPNFGQITLPSPPQTPPPGHVEASGGCAFDEVQTQLLDTQTPLTRASPAARSFPFPRVECTNSPLTPFSSRASGSLLRPSQYSPASTSRSSSTTPSQTPDRFIPPRRPFDAARDSFQLSTSPSKLSPIEKARRNRDAGTDPFARRNRSASAGTLSAARPAAVRGLRQNSNFPPLSNGPLGAGRLSLAGDIRQISHGAVWAIGGAAASADGVNGVSNGRGGLFASGSSAPLYRTNFLDRLNSAAEREGHEHRIALALDVDTASRVLPPASKTPTSWVIHSPATKSLQSFQHTRAFGATVWKDGEWSKEGATTSSKNALKTKRAVPIIPFRVLDAPSLRDDFYCSLLAYSASAKCLAVGLGSHVYLWSEGHGVDTPESLNAPYHAHVTSISFSSAQGKKDVLAIGRACGRLLLWSPSEEVPRLTSVHPTPVCCVSFRPTTVKRPSRRDRHLEVNTEELVLGDEIGHIYFYSIEWPTQDQYDLFGFPGDLNLLCRITIHTQQICGLAWSTDGDFFASGGNDNICHLFETKRVLQFASKDGTDDKMSTNRPTSGPRMININTNGESFNLGPLVARHQWTVLAAVKAIAFCPWQRGLIAVGGGSNDRCIHFYHTLSGSCLATIDCSAQVTSLIWSTTRREIAATFGFAQPEHPYRIAVFSWPKCEVVVRVPWFEEHRALFAIPYPGGPNNGLSKGEGGVWWSRTQEEGCIVVATSDSSIKFHEVWAEERKSVNSKGGLLGGSDILESLHGIEKDQAEVIR